MLSHWKQIWLKISIDFWLVTKYVKTSPNSSNPYAMKLECLKSDFCAPKFGKEMEKRRVGRKKRVLELKEMDWVNHFFKMELFASIFFCFKWLLMLTVLSTENFLWFLLSCTGCYLILVTSKFLKAVFTSFTWSIYEYIDPLFSLKFLYWQ